jgi:hypothetical protein
VPPTAAPASGRAIVTDQHVSLTGALQYTLLLVPDADPAAARLLLLPDSLPSLAERARYDAV